MKNFIFIFLLLFCILLCGCNDCSDIYLDGYDQGYQDGYKAGEEDAIANSFDANNFHYSDTIGYLEGQADMFYTFFDNYSQYFPEDVMIEIREMESEIYDQLQEIREDDSY